MQPPCSRPVWLFSHSLSLVCFDASLSSITSFIFHKKAAQRTLEVTKSGLHTTDCLIRVNLRIVYMDCWRALEQLKGKSCQSVALRKPWQQVSLCSLHLIMRYSSTLQTSRMNCKFWGTTDIYAKFHSVANIVSMAFVFYVIRNIVGEVATGGTVIYLEYYIPIVPQEDCGGHFLNLINKPSHITRRSLF